MNGKCPCINCDARHIYCHGSCEKYAAWKKQRSEEFQKVYRNRGKDSLQDRFIREMKYKEARNKG